MYAHVHLRRMAPIVVVVFVFTIGSAAAQDPQAEGHQHAGHVLTHEEPSIPDTRDGSGTSWLPDDSPMYAVHGQARGWTLMGHGSLFLQYLHETGDRGSHQTGSINWVMGMARRPLGGGRLTLRGMISAEPWTIAGCGYPDMLATGESCEDEAIHDRQHPHDLFMELGAEYERPLGRGISLQLYGAPVGEPALGPVAFMHRVSGLHNPLAPITHHWFDSTHITFGVVTAGLFARQWKIEASAFNGREPDENRTDFDMAAMDSWSGRVWFLPTARWAFQVSAGRLTEAEPAHDGEPAVDVDRMTASVTYHHTTASTAWATTLGWGRNAESTGDATNAVLVESGLTIRDRDAIYGRFEWAQKSGHDLAVDEHGSFDIAKLQGGYTRFFTTWKRLTFGAGAEASAGFVPQQLEPAYGGRVNPGFGVYLTVRPAMHQM